MLSMMQRAGAGASRLSVQRAFHAAASSPGAFHVCQKALAPSVESGLLRQGGGLPRLFARRFARDTQRSRYANRKPAQTKVREREQEQWAQPPAQQAYGQLGRQEDEERGRQMDSLDDSGVRSHLTKVYATLGGTIGVSAFGSLGAMTIPGMMMSPLIPGLASLVPLFWLYRTTPDTHSEPFRGALLGSFALLSGATLLAIQNHTRHTFRAVSRRVAGKFRAPLWYVNSAIDCDGYVDEPYACAHGIGCDHRHVRYNDTRCDGCSQGCCAADGPCVVRRNDRYFWMWNWGYVRRTFISMVSCTAFDASVW